MDYNLEIRPFATIEIVEAYDWYESKKEGLGIDFLNELKILRESKSPQQKKELNKDNSYSQKQIAIAYYVMGITITEKNAKGIIEKHSTTKSKKILQKLITKTNQLTVLTNNKTTDTKHLRDLKEAKRLLSGIKMKKSKHDINFIITAFQTSYDNKY